MSENAAGKRARLRDLLSQQQAREPIQDTLVARPRQGLEPLSCGQRGLWFLAKLDGASAAYNVPVAIHFSGLLDVDRLSRSLSAVVQRHETLRTKFIEIDGVPWAVRVADEPICLLAERTPEGRARALCHDEAQRPFDIEREKLARFRLFEEPGNRFTLLIVMHHAISDAWSVGILVRELVAAYDALSSGRVPDLPPLEVSYSDYVHWEEDRLRSGALDESIRYWTHQLRGLSCEPLLPQSGTGEQSSSRKCAAFHFSLAQPLLDKLKALSGAHRTSLFVTLVAGLQLLLSRYSLRREVVLGTAATTRRFSKLERLIGFFVNTLVLRNAVDPEASFEALLCRVRDSVLDAFEHQDAPYHRVVEELRANAQQGDPRVEVMFTLQNVPYQDHFRSSGVRIEIDLPVIESAKFDLSIAMQESAGGLRGRIEYRTALFEEETIVRFAEHFRRLLTEVTSNAAAPTGRIDFLTDAEKRLLHAWSGPAADASRSPLRIDETFERTVRSQPEAIALMCAGRAVSYAELDECASRVSEQITLAGVGPGDRIAVCIERSPELIIGLLGILKSGAAYVPVETDSRSQRLRTILHDAQVALVLLGDATDELGWAEGFVAMRIGDLIAQNAATVECASTARAARGAIDRPACVMYTSGSTGTPKGVVVPHSGVTRLVCEADFVPLSRSTTTLLHSAVSFDASTFEIWAPLLNGGRLVIWPGEAADVDGIVQTVISAHVNTLWLTAGMLPLWAERCRARRLPVRYLLVGGDVVSAACVREIEEQHPDVTLINGYGPTENTTFSCCYTIPRSADLSHGVPIGRPIRRSTAYVLDERHGLQPIGCVGELHVGGDGLALGYLNEPELTARRFLPGGIAGTRGERLYATGDRARWRSDGNLEFLGRADRQVKIRGYRVEPAEAEMHLERIPGIAAACVLAARRGDFEKRLIAYLVVNRAKPEINDDLSAEEKAEWVGRCRSHLSDALPAYMVPSSFVFLARLPLTSNGKVDRQALPDPQDDATLATAYRAPEGALETSLCAIWQEVLGVPRVGVDDDFFGLGGHSLLATQLLARMRQESNVGVSLQRLFQTPTVSGIVASLAQTPADDAEDRLPTLSKDEVNRYAPFGLTAVQQAYLLGRSSAFDLGNISTHAYMEINLTDLDVARLEQAWNATLRRHDMLRAIFLDDGTQRVLESTPDYHIDCEDLSAIGDDARKERLGAIRERMSHQVFAVSNWPLFEVRVSRLTARDFRLHFSMDALPSDAASSLILVREVERRYSDPATELPDLQLYFRDYVMARDALRRTRAYEISRDYWKQRAASLPPAPDLPLTRALSSVTQPRFERRTHFIDAGKWRRLQDLARHMRVTPAVLLITVFSLVLARWSRSQRFTLNVTLFNRLPVHPQINEIVGDFTSLILLEIEAGNVESLAALARRIQRDLWAGMEHRQFDGVEVLRLVNRGVAAGRAALMPVVFTSALGLGGPHEPGGAFADALSDPSSGGNFGITQTSQVLLDNVVREQGGALTITWDALRDVFCEGVLDAMFEAHTRILEDLAAGRLVCTAPVPAHLPQDQQRIRAMVSRTEAPMPCGVLHDPFRRQVALIPGNEAVICGSSRLDYAEVDRRAHVVAEELAALRVRANEPVAIVMVKGWEQIVAAIGALYSGAPYMPIDAELPPERISLLLDQGNVRVALTQSQFSAVLHRRSGLHVVEVDALCALEKPLRSLPLNEAAPGDLAYVIFTSGSSGVPKGVMVEHRSALNTIVDMNERFGFGGRDRVLGISSLSFDLSVFDIFGVLGAGGTLVLPDREREKDPAHWLELVRREGITLWNSVPALAQLLAEEMQRVAGASRPTSLRCFLLSGDWIPLSLPDRLRELLPGTRLVSLGGATEASIWSVWYPIDAVDTRWRSIPYGVPLANQGVEVLCADFSPCPDWVEGSLYIKGVGLARGYWADPGKTNAAFVTHPATGERVYRTGDLARYRPDGSLELIGREDTQVKIHGHRVELGEIESVLAQHPEVARAVALVTGATDGQKRLVAYVVPARQLDFAEAAGEGTSLDVGAGVLRDRAARAVFRLQRRGLRAIPAGASVVDLARPAERPGGRNPFVMIPESLTLPHRPECFRGARSGAAIPLVHLGAWLACLESVPVEGHPIGKRFYPSAGSLYPIQVFLRVMEGSVEGVGSGAYYYDPVGHRLVRADESTASWLNAARTSADGNGLSVLLVAAWDAVMPIYGEMSRRVSLLEVGHVGELLASSAAACAIDITSKPWTTGTGAAQGPLLSGGHEVLAALTARPAASTRTALVPVTLFERQSFRAFSGGAVGLGRLVALLARAPRSELRTVLYVKTGGEPSAQSGTFYRLDAPHGALVRLSEVEDSLILSSHGLENRGTHARAAFSVYLVGRSVDDETTFASGCVGQGLMMSAGSLGLGLCPVGNLASAGLRGSMQLDPEERVVYAFEGGAVSVEQQRSVAADISDAGRDGFAELREYLARRLPLHMIPALFVPLARLPLSANGKVDREALHAIGLPTTEQPERIDPRNDVERSIAALWSELLGVQDVGVYDNFFEAGGDSLSAMRLLSAVRSRFGADATGITLEEIFKSQTIAALAQLIGRSAQARRLEEIRSRVAGKEGLLEEGEVA